jgi:hypothetical protein
MAEEAERSSWGPWIAARLRGFVTLFVPEEPSEWTYIGTTLVSLVVFGLVLVLVTALGIKGSAQVALLIAGAGLAIGGALGFLFAIPRGLRGQDAAANTGGAPARLVDYRANTNLEEISDWLTKILVGVGLTQLLEIPRHAWRIAGLVAPSLKAESMTAAQTLVLLDAAYFLTFGFLFSYLWSRMFLAAVFHRADQAVGLRLTQNQLLGQIHTHLYEYEDQGFREAIKDGEAFIRQYGRGATSWVWLYLACAYGQQARWVLDHKRDGDQSGRDLEQARDRAYEAVEMALRLKPSLRGMLIGMWHEGSSYHVEGDDDLTAFVDDEKFEKLLGPKKEPAKAA